MTEPTSPTTPTSPTRETPRTMTPMSLRTLKEIQTEAILLTTPTQMRAMLRRSLVTKGVPSRTMRALIRMRIPALKDQVNRKAIRITLTRTRVENLMRRMQTDRLALTRANLKTMELELETIRMLRKEALMMQRELTASTILLEEIKELKATTSRKAK